eukprot:COSAG04_NODE_2848_length_3489_cov_2.165487_3_plen_154_part_00
MGAAQRKIYAWAGPSNATIAQLTNDSWKGVIDGVQAGCGVHISAGSQGEADDAAGPMMVVNETVFAKCAPLKQAVEGGGGEFQVWTNGVPQSLVDDAALRPPFIASAIALAHKHGIQVRPPSPRRYADLFTPRPGLGRGTRSTTRPTARRAPR